MKNPQNIALGAIVLTACAALLLVGIGQIVKSPTDITFNTFAFATFASMGATAITWLGVKQVQQSDEEKNEAKRETARAQGQMQAMTTQSQLGMYATHPPPPPRIQEHEIQS